jgi:hypothetical protein
MGARVSQPSGAVSRGRLPSAHGPTATALPALAPQQKQRQQAAGVPAPTAAACSGAGLDRQFTAGAGRPPLPPTLRPRHCAHDAAAAAAAAGAGEAGAAPGDVLPAMQASALQQTALAAAAPAADGSAGQPGRRSDTAGASWAAGHQPWQAAAAGARGASLHDLPSGGPWQASASSTAYRAAVLAAGAEMSNEFSRLGLSRQTGSAGAGWNADLDGAAAAAAAADGSERPSKRHACGDLLPGDASAGSGDAAAGMRCAPAGAGAQPGQQAAQPFSTQPAGGSPANNSVGGAGGGWPLSLPLGEPVGFDGAAPFVWPPLGAASGSGTSAQVLLGLGAPLFNATAAAAGDLPASPAMPPPPSGMQSKSTTTVRG